MIQNIGQIGIPVKDIERAVDFYKNKLNLNLLFQTDSMAFFETGGIRLMLTLPENETFDHPGSVVYFNVNDIHEASSTHQKRGITFISDPHLIAKMGTTETWMSFFHDTEGNTHALMSEVEQSQ
ncbi:VOC family protein [Jeotgalibacillus sp. R-1-5s-1]|uniref:VOC family protein n=1 Tax=Jeotgalibacillus sp. R-1-5s-1 TaxID=2555897 RepID=UPI00106AA72A|nr:VOC family protein [Jeotgalibacillus sp. R-1-5s-1]TFE00217.1 VOC family protein [Jeotgalibacillus sp. R-1-5s-1]